jgi:hypothetical protein
MSNLQRRKREPAIEEDIETPIAPRKCDAAASPSAASSATGTGSSHRPGNPAPPARTVLRKEVLRPRRDEFQDGITTTGGWGGIIALLKDSAVCFALGLVAVAILLFLDHRNAIHVQGAHDFRNAEFAMVRNPETRAWIEEGSGLKLMSAEEHALKAREVETFPPDIAGHEERIGKYLADLEVAKREHAAIKPGYDILMSDPILGLEKLCLDCIWDEDKPCDLRLSFLMRKYKLTSIKGKLQLMKSDPQCVRKCEEDCILLGTGG